MEEREDKSDVAEEPQTFFEFLARATPRLIATPAIIVVNAAVFAAMPLFGVSTTSPEIEELWRFGAGFGPLTLEGQWWRLLSATFVHIGLLHLVFNMWFLWSLGRYAERMFGNGVFLLIYVFSGLGGSTASLLWHPDITTAGASGAVFGIVGALVAFLYLGHIRVPPHVTRELLVTVSMFFGFLLLMGTFQEGIDNAGHLGGLVMGLALGAALHRPLPVEPRAAQQYLAVPAAALTIVAACGIAYDKAADDPYMRLAEARRLEVEGDREGAIEKLEEAAAIAPEIAEVHAALGLAYMRADRYQDAVPPWERASELSPNSAAMKSDLGLAYMQAERFEEAIETYREAVALDPQLYTPQKNLGITLGLAGRDEEAVKELRVASQMEPDDVSVYVMLSGILLELERADEAVEELEEALTWAPEAAEVHSAMGLAQLKNGEQTQAVASLRKAVELDPEDAEHHNRLALALAVAGDGDAALETIERALELLPDAPHILDSLGTVRFYRGEYDLAAEAYGKAKEAASDQAIYYYNSSLALRRQGRIASADRDLNEARRLAPDREFPSDGSPIL